MKKHSLLALSILSLLGGCINPYLYQDRPAPVLNLGNFRTDIPTEPTEPTEPQPQAPEAPTEDSWSNPPTPINAEEDNPYAPITPPQKQPNDDNHTGDITAPTLQKERPVRPPERPMRPEPSEQQERPTRPAPSDHHDAPWNSKPSETRPAPRPEPPSPAERPAPSRPVTPTPPPAEETTPTTPQAAANPVNYMILQAQKAVSKHDLESAAAYLENAQRIAPNNAKILYDIANIRYHQGRYSDAETFASRAVNVGGNARMMKKSWALIAKARKSRGDNQGAVAAAEKASTY